MSEVSHPPLSADLFRSPEKYVQHFRALSQKNIERCSPTKLEENQSQEQVKPETRRTSLPSYRQSSHTRVKNLLVAGKSTPNLFTNSSRPVTGKEKNVHCLSSVSNMNVEDFMNRFEQKAGVKKHQIASKGLMGWKLKQLRLKAKETKNDYSRLFKVTKETDNVFNELSSRRLSSAG